MLSINQKSYDVLAEASTRPYKNFLIDRINRLPEFQKEMFVDYGAELFVEDLIVRANDYGIHSECDVTRFFDCVTNYGIDFGESPETHWAKKMLENKQIHGRVKMDRIQRYIENLAPEE